MDVSWLTTEAQAALAAVRDAQGERGSVDARKRRYTIQRLAWALAIEGFRSDDEFFEREKHIPKDDPRRDKMLTARSTWWKIRDFPDIQAARAACQAAADSWRDRESQQVQIAARRRVIAALAKHADRGVVEGLLGIIEDKGAKGTERLQAIERFVQLLDPELAARIPGETPPGMTMEVQGLDALIDAELARVAGGRQDGAAGPVTGPCDEFSILSDEAG